MKLVFDGLTGNTQVEAVERGDSHNRHHDEQDDPADSCRRLLSHGRTFHRFSSAEFERLHGLLWSVESSEGCSYQT